MIVGIVLGVLYLMIGVGAAAERNRANPAETVTNLLLIIPIWPVAIGIILSREAGKR